MDFIWESITDWLKEILISGIVSNLSGMFDSTNEQVGNIVGQVGMTPQSWNSGIFTMIQNLSNTVILPIAGAILAIVMTLELIQLVTDRNNLNDVDTWMFFKWVFKSACAVVIVTHTWDIVMGIFEASQSVVNSAAGVIVGQTSIDISSVVGGLESRLSEMDLGPLFGLWFQSLFVGLCTWAITICIFIITYGRMIEVFLVCRAYPHGDYGQPGMGTDGAELSANPPFSGLPGVSHCGLRGDLLSAGTEHFRIRRHWCRHLDLHGLYRAALLLPVQNQQPCPFRIQCPLRRCVHALCNHSQRPDKN